jgi:flagellar biosynthesis protein FlhG
MELLNRGMNPNGDGGISGTHELMGELARVNADCWLKAKIMLSHFMPNIIVNMTMSENDIKIGYKLKAIIAKYLSVNATFLGQVDEDPAVKMSAKKMVPFSVYSPGCKAAKCIGHIVESLLDTAPNIREREARPLGVRPAEGKA